MKTSIPNVKAAVMPTIPYRNMLAMVDWLCEAFGFQKQIVVKGENGEIKHAQLVFGASTIMVFPFQDLASEKLVVHPDQVGGVETQTCYVVVADVEEHYARAKAKGADIIFGIRAGNYGGRGYASRDPEGHVWMFGTYDPQQGQSLATRTSPKPKRASARAYLLTLALCALTLASGGAAYVTYSSMKGPLFAQFRLTGPAGGQASTDAIHQLLQEERSARRAAEQEAKALAAKLVEVRTAKESADRKVTELSGRLARESTAQEGAEQEGKQAQGMLAQAMRERDNLARAAKYAEDQLHQATIAKETAERLVKNAIDQLDRVRLEKIGAERIAKEITEKCEREKTLAVKDALERLARESSARAAAELATNELRNQLASFGNDPQHRIAELRLQVEAEQHAKGKIEREANDAKFQLAQEKHSRDATERALKQAQQKLASNHGSCWACPSAAPCERQQ